MPLSNKDLSDIAKEFGIVKAEQADDKSNLPAIDAETKKKEEQAARAYIPYNNAQIERVTPYETERRWLDGTTYTTITQSQIETFSATDGRNAYFFPVSWTKSNAQLQPNSNGNPTSISLNSESNVLNRSLESQGLISQINLLRNGQSSSVPSDNLDLAYSPGASTIEVEDTGHTNGNLLYISGSGTSALVRIINVFGTTLTIAEIVPPANTIAIGGSVVENIPGFSNSERNTLTSASYQRILTELTNRIISSAASWNAALNNQLAQLNINIDSVAQVNTAKTNVNTAKTAYDTWFALSNTGASGKFIDTSLNNLATAYNTRNSFIPTRASQITAALGIVTQNSNGDYSGNGLYLQRFKCLNYLISSANGALFQANSLKGAKGNTEQKILNAADKLATYSNLVRYGAFIEDPSGSVVKVDQASQFANGDLILLTGNDLPVISCQIVSISGSSVTLSITIPSNYTKDSKAGIIKSI
jgi:hypothetical protein